MEPQKKLMQYLIFSCSNSTAFIHNESFGVQIDAISMRKFASIIDQHYRIVDSKFLTSSEKILKLSEIWFDVSGIVGHHLLSLR